LVDPAVFASHEVEECQAAAEEHHAVHVPGAGGRDLITQVEQPLLIRRKKSKYFIDIGKTGRLTEYDDEGRKKKKEPIQAYFLPKSIFSAEL
jgi:hypothetical protein